MKTIDFILLRGENSLLDNWQETFFFFGKEHLVITKGHLHGIGRIKRSLGNKTH